MAFTAEEKARIKHHLSYPDWVSLAQSIQLGFPAASQPAFLVDDAFGRLTPEAEGSVRTDLCECEDIEVQLRSARGRLKASKVGDVTLNPMETKQLKQELNYWITRLGDDLGVVPDPYSRMIYEAIGNVGGTNSNVIG